jgi:beta-lactamase superfamily II metal-dependent hydrolase
MVRECYIAILDVGHGNCAVCFANSDVAVVDTGLGSSLLEFLAEKNIQELSTVFISHADNDHIGGLIALLSSGTVAVRSVYLNPDAIKGSAVWDDLAFLLGQRDRTGDLAFNVNLTRGDSIELGGGGIKLEALAPDKYLVAKGAGSKDRKGRRLASNSMSVVVRVTTNDRSILLPGDLDQIGLLNILEGEDDIQAEILVFPHHGGAPGGNVEEFVDCLQRAVSPETVLFSIGRTSHNNPRPEVLARLRKNDPNIKIQCTQLSTNCRSTAVDKQPSYVSEIYSRGRESNACCAGTIVVTLCGSTEPTPPEHLHAAFVDEITTNALCRR